MELFIHSSILLFSISVPHHISHKPCNSSRRVQVHFLSAAAYLSEAIKELWEQPAVPHESISGGMKANAKLTDLQ